MTHSPPPPVHRRRLDSGVYRIRRRSITLRRKPVKVEPMPPVTKKRERRMSPWIWVACLALVFAGTWLVVARFG